MSARWAIWNDLRERARTVAAPEPEPKDLNEWARELNGAIAARRKARRPVNREHDLSGVIERARMYLAANTDAMIGVRPCEPEEW